MIGVENCLDYLDLIGKITHLNLSNLKIQIRIL